VSRSHFFVLAVVCVVGIGCESSTNEIVPTSASRVDNAAGSAAITILPPALATLTGTVQNLTRQPALIGTGPMDATSLRVLVVGTELSSEVNSSGQFTLEEVPSDFVVLSFQGPGVNAPVRLGALPPGQRVHIAVIVTGDTARIAASKSGGRDDDPRNRDVEIEGRLARLTGDCPLVMFAVGDASVKTNTVTNTDGGCSDLRNGLRVEVKGRRQSDGSVLASRIEREER
jgi:Domain of unknown function (DUF5666)